MEQTNYLNNLYDVVIVGGGPAGATAGFLLRSKGLSVLIIEKYRFPRNKLCGGQITHKTIKIIGELFGETVDSLLEKKVINYGSSFFEVRVKDSVLVSKEVKQPLYFVDRTTYDNYLLNRAKDSGVDVIEGDKVIAINFENHEVRTSSNNVFKGKFIIAADGANSIIRKSFTDLMGGSLKFIRNQAMALEVNIPRKEFTTTIDRPILVLGFVKWGYGWVFPNKDEIMVGVGGLNGKKVNHLDSLKNLLLSIGFKGEVPRASGHPIPYGNFLSSPVYQSTLLIGDAAGLVDPILGEGIYYAHKSAEIAADSIEEAILSGEPIEKIYSRLLKSQILNELIFAKWISYLLFGFMAKINYLPLKFIIKRYDTNLIEIVNGMRSYQWFRKRVSVD